MNMSSLVDLAGTGATWVLYLLIGLSAIQLALIIERGLMFWRTRAGKGLELRVREAIETGSVKAIALIVNDASSLEGRVIAAGVAATQRGVQPSEMMHATAVDEKLRLERGLSFLGTMGNNAPFIGLLGTVLGVIHSVAHLGQGTGQASSAVMSGISEALISTAVGLIVALPAVIAFNTFQRIIKTRAVAAEGLGDRLLAHLEAPAASRRAA